MHIIRLLIVINILIVGCSKDINDIYINESLTATSKLIYSNNFEKSLDDWKVEQMPEGIVKINDEKLEIDDVSGCTIWLKKEFKGSLLKESYIIGKKSLCITSNSLI